MKKSQEVPSFLIELPHSISSIILRRRYLLRSQKSRVVNALKRSGSSAWIKVGIASSSLLEPNDTWNNAHMLADKFQVELGQQAYVEPSSKAGIYVSLFGENQIDEPASEPSANHLSPRIPLGVGATVKSNIGLGGAGFEMTRAFTPAAPNSFLPEQAQQAIKEQTALNKDVRCPLLYKLSGWNDLSEVKRKMFETECAQIIKAGMHNRETPTGDYTTLALVASQASASRALKFFLHRALSLDA